MALEVLRVSFTAVVLIGVLTNLGIEFHADVRLLDRIVMKLSYLNHRVYSVNHTLVGVMYKYVHTYQ